MSGVMISKSPAVVVKASEPVMAAGDIKLSPYDMWFVNDPVTVFLVFEHPIREPVETIKRGLSQALVHYYPVAGRLAVGATAGELVINCTANGVSFVAASANCALKDVQDLSDPSLKEELAVFYPAANGLCRSSDPLVLMQVTVFSCGGFVLGLTLNHAVADGVGMAQFLQAIGELSRGLPSPSVVPIRQDDSLILIPPPVFTKFLQYMGSIQPSQMAVLNIAVKSSLISHIKEKYASMNPGRRCSAFDAVAAVLWRCRTRATMSDPDALNVLLFIASARKYAGAKEGYYGNCLMVQLVSATAGAVANGDITDIVKMIHGTKNRVPHESDIDNLLQVADSYNIMSMNSWRSLVIRPAGEAIDFGGGAPARAMGHSTGISLVPKCTSCLPGNDEYNVLAVCVKEDHASAFLQELERTHLIPIRSLL
ncbi:hypothetical protein QYE76_030068 [Lolium multiflorum]|uniref:Uncharacterized protein n=1 Tax=Lolium multiflorum TaxID=4521 RepID=A0AAD8VIX0_LOLMU|nr:hypothetical protein QYE76_030068 [Lolium multiflorum]